MKKPCQLCGKTDDDAATYRLINVFFAVLIVAALAVIAAALKFLL